MTKVKKSSLSAKEKKTVKPSGKILKKTSDKAPKKASFANSGKIVVANQLTKVIKLNISNDPLDTYLSPHLLDLSGLKFIEKIRPNPEIKVNYEDFPGGETLSKLGVFHFFDFNQSPIVSFLKSLNQKAFSASSSVFGLVDFSVKIQGVEDKKSWKDEIWWQEITLVNLFLSVWIAISKIGSIFSGLFSVITNSWKQSKTDDIIIPFDLKQSYQSLSEMALSDSVASEESDFFEQLSSAHKRENAFELGKKPRGKKAIKSEITRQSFSFVFYPTWGNFVRAAVVFAVITLMIVAPVKLLSYWQNVQQVKGRVLGEAEVAVSNLESAKSALTSLDFQAAGEYFTQANQHFVSAQGQLDQIKSFLTDLAENAPVSNSYKSGKNILDLGDNLSLAGEHLLKAVNELKGDSDLSIGSKVENFKVESQFALEKLKLAQDNFTNIDPKNLPSSSIEKFNQIKDLMPDFVASLQKAIDISDFAVNFLGNNDLRRYLVVFQNSNELRATGGFMGSFALVDLENGKLKKITLPPGGTYDVRAGLKELIKAPQPMMIMNTMWELQDGNWWPDWPTSAQNTSWLYQKSGGPTVDGVIAINSNWMKELLKVTGPIDLPNYDETITADNFEMAIQKEVEITHTDDKKPKQILADLAPKLMDKIFNIQPKDFLPLASAIQSGLDQKDILMYFGNDELASFAQQNDWDGRQKTSTSDYLNVIATNVGGGKTDNVINQDIYHQAEIQSDGSIIDKVLISRHDFGPIDSYFTTWTNRDYFRIYVPKGSKLISAAGFSAVAPDAFKKPESYLKEDPRLDNENNATLDVTSGVKTYDENGKTVFANWSLLKPGASQDIVLTYKLPFKIEPTSTAVTSTDFMGKIKAVFGQSEEKTKVEGVYNLLWQKQAGRNNDKFSSELIYPESWKPGSIYPNNLTFDNNKIGIKATSTKDIFYLAGFDFSK